MDRTDYIVSYIDFSQKEIRDLYRQVSGEEYKSNVNKNYIDFALLLRLVLKNMPFIGKLHVVCKDAQNLSDDTEALMKESDGRIVRVNESEFMPEGFVTFSSACIELFMWRIPDLAEQFIYGNDDMIPLNELKESDFFKEGKPVMQFGWQNSSFSSLYDLHNSNSTNLVFDRKRNNDEYDRNFYATHTMRPLTKSICKECYEEYEKFIFGSLHPVRFFNNLNMDLYLLYGYKKGEVLGEDLPYKFEYYPASEEWSLSLLEKVEQGRETEDVVCMNDECWIGGRESMLVRDILDKLMKKRLGL